MRSVILTATLSVLLAGLAAGAARGQAPGPLKPELKRLEFILGETTGKGKIYLPGVDPISWESQDRSAWALGGAYLRTDTKMTYVGFGPQENLFLTTFDPKEKVYRLWAFWQLTAAPMECAGNFEGEKLVMVSKPFDNGLTGPAVYRVTFEPKGRDVLFLAEMKMGETWTRSIEGVYTKKQ